MFIGISHRLLFRQLNTMLVGVCDKFTNGRAEVMKVWIIHVLQSFRRGTQCRRHSKGNSWLLQGRGRPFADNSADFCCFGFLIKFQKHSFLGQLKSEIDLL